MPRTSVIEPPGCPPLRAISCDVLGLIKVIEPTGEKRVPQVVKKWGTPDPNRAVLASSITNCCSKNNLLAVARKNGEVEIMNADDGRIVASVNVEQNSPLEELGCSKPDMEHVVGLHIFKKDSSDLLLACTDKGNASFKSVLSRDTLKTWKMCSSGNIGCCSVDASENYAAVGGKGVEIRAWDLSQCTNTWTSKPPPRDSLGIFTPTWFTAVSFLGKSHQKIVTGTCQHQVRLYDTSAQRRAVLTFDFRQSAIKVISSDEDGCTVYVGNGMGDLASYDIRTGKMIGSFIGKCCGSIRSIARHPELPVLATCGLDRYVRFWNVKTRQILSSVFLKQELNSVVFDTSYVGQDESADKENTTPSSVDQRQDADIIESADYLKRNSSTQSGSEGNCCPSKKAKVKSKKRTTDNNK